jgi:hypothetical protein
VFNVCGKGGKIGLSSVGQNGNSRMLSGGVGLLGCDSRMMDRALDIWRARAVDELSARVWVAHEVGDSGSCLWAVNVLKCLLAVPRMLVGMERASSRAL